MKRPRRTIFEIRLHLLRVLADGKEHSFGDLERSVNTFWLTIRDLCTDLEVFKCVTIDNHRVKITKEGREVLKRLEKRTK